MLTLCKTARMRRHCTYTRIYTFRVQFTVTSAVLVSFVKCLFMALRSLHCPSTFSGTEAPQRCVWDFSAARKRHCVSGLAFTYLLKNPVPPKRREPLTQNQKTWIPIVLLMTPRRKVLHEKRIPQLVKKFPAFYGTRTFIAVLTTAVRPIAASARFHIQTERNSDFPRNKLGTTYSMQHGTVISCHWVDSPLHSN
jgi:hypothetical protein